MKLVEIYRSVEGEVNFFGQGRLTTLVRFGGCNLRCSYCDAAYAQEAGEETNVPEVIERIMELGLKKVTLTGGEPLLQPDCVDRIANALGPLGYDFTCETNGTQPLLIQNRYIYWVVDFKLPSSGHPADKETFPWDDIGNGDFVKFVIKTEEDYKAAVEASRRGHGTNKCTATFAFSLCDPTDLTYKWLLEELLKDKIFYGHINVQIHKMIGLK